MAPEPPAAGSQPVTEICVPAADSGVQPAIVHAASRNRSPNPNRRLNHDRPDADWEAAGRSPSTWALPMTPEVPWPSGARDREALERQIAGSDPEAGLGHDYDGPELRSGTPEYEALYAEYQAWVAQPEPEAGAMTERYARDPDPGLIDRLGELLFPWLYPEVSGLRPVCRPRPPGGQV